MPRKVSRSKELQQRSLPSDEEAVLCQIENLASSGGDLKPYLHRPIKKSKYNDALLNDWGIHHFHLGSRLEADGFVNRTSELLFAHVSRERFLMIDVLDHSSFNDDALIEVVHANWPEVLSRYAAPEVVSVVDPPNPERREKYRRAGVVTLTQVADGTVYVPPGGGYQSSGLSSDALSCAFRILNRATHLSDWAIENSDAIAHSIKNATGIEVGTLDLRLCFGRDGMFVIETHSNSCIWSETTE